MVDDRVERLARVARLVLSDPVVDDDRVVDAEADDGQHRRHEQRVDLDPEQRAQDRERADDDDDVVEQGDERRHAELDVCGTGMPIQSRMPSEPSEDEQDRLLDELRADDRADGRLDPVQSIGPNFASRAAATARRACRSSGG